MKNTVTQDDIYGLLTEAEASVSTLYDKCTVVCVKLKNGFVLTESSACVDPENYSESVGFEECMKRIENKLWELEGYALQKKLYEEAQHDNHH